jgi:hypothetical protein
MSTPYRTRGFHALAHDFRVVSDSEPLGRYLENMLDGFPTAREVTSEYVLTERTDDDGARLLELRMDDEIVTGTGGGDLAGSFVHHVNRQAIEADYAVMCHAGGVELDGAGLILPAHMESGKTTLTTGLVRAGFGYLTDEAVAFDRETALIEPFPKPLSIDAGAQHLFPELEPDPAPGDDAPPAEQWQVPPDAIRRGAVGRSCPARFIVFPMYERDAVTTLVPMSRASGLVELATNTFSFRDHPRRSLDLLARVVDGAQCFKLTVGNLDEACAVIVELVGAEDLLSV